MDNVKIGLLIRELRQSKGMTQSALGELLGVSDRAVSKWECGKGLPDISMITAISEIFGIGEQQLLDGNLNINEKSNGNLSKIKLYCCPHCGGIYTAIGNGRINCCGYSLEPLKAQNADNAHEYTITEVEDEYFIEWNHPMTKQHYISFAAVIYDDCCIILKLYPEQSPSVRVKHIRGGKIYFYCSKDGLMELRV